MRRAQRPVVCARVTRDGECWHHRPVLSLQEEAVETRTIKPALPDAPPVELPPLPTEFPPLPEIKLPVIEEVCVAEVQGWPPSEV